MNAFDFSAFCCLTYPHSSVLGLVMVVCTSMSVLVALPACSTCAEWLSAG